MKKQVVKYDGYGNPTCKCGHCGLLIGLQDGGRGGVTGIGYFDKRCNKMYFAKGTPGCYVHFRCLTKVRKSELFQEALNEVLE